MSDGPMEVASTRVALLAPFRGGLLAAAPGPEGPFSLPSAIQERGTTWQETITSALLPHLEVDPEVLKIFDIVEHEGGNLLLTGSGAPLAARASYLASDFYALEESDLEGEWASPLEREVAARWFTERNRLREQDPGNAPHDTLILRYDAAEKCVTGEAWIEEAEGALTHLRFDQDGTFDVDVDHFNWLTIQPDWLDQADTLMGQFMRVCDIIDTRINSVVAGMPEPFALDFEAQLPRELIEDLLTPDREAAEAEDSFLFIPSTMENYSDCYVLISDTRVIIETNAAKMGSPCKVRLRTEDGAEARAWTAKNLEIAKSVAVDCAAELARVPGARL